MKGRAIVVGASSGIGREVAVQLAEAGWEVSVAGRREEKLKELTASVGNIVAYLVLDVCSPDSAESLRHFVEQMGGVDLYFHSSGIGYQNPGLDMSKEISTAETNVVGATRLLGEMFNYFSAHPEREAHLAVISSIAGTRSLGAAPSYSASKRYVNHYMDCLRQLCAIRRIRHIRLHDVRPGFVRTALLGDGGRYPMQMDAAAAARLILRGIRKNRGIITIDWRYRRLVGLWRLIPSFLRLRLPLASKK